MININDCLWHTGQKENNWNEQMLSGYCVTASREQVSVYQHWNVAYGHTARQMVSSKFFSSSFPKFVVWWQVAFGPLEDLLFWVDMCLCLGSFNKVLDINFFSTFFASNIVIGQMIFFLTYELTVHEEVSVK